MRVVEVPAVTEVVLQIKELKIHQPPALELNRLSETKISFFLHQFLPQQCLLVSIEHPRTCTTQFHLSSLTKVSINEEIMKLTLLTEWKVQVISRFEPVRARTWRNRVLPPLQMMLPICMK